MSNGELPVLGSVVVVIVCDATVQSQLELQALAKAQRTTELPRASCGKANQGCSSTGEQCSNCERVGQWACLNCE